MGGDWDRVETGAPDVHRLRTARRVATTHEPLVGETAFDSTVDPQTLQLSMKAGIQADTGRLDVTWTDAGYYRYHYTEVIRQLWTDDILRETTGQERNRRYEATDVLALVEPYNH